MGKCAIAVKTSVAAVGADGATLNLAVFDGNSADNHKMPEWYADNSGMLDYTIEYVGP